MDDYNKVHEYEIYRPNIWSKKVRKVFITAVDRHRMPNVFLFQIAGTCEKITCNLNPSGCTKKVPAL